MFKVLDFSKLVDQTPPKATTLPAWNESEEQKNSTSTSNTTTVNSNNSSNVNSNNVTPTASSDLGNNAVPTNNGVMPSLRDSSRATPSNPTTPTKESQSKEAIPTVTRDRSSTASDLDWNKFLTGDETIVKNAVLLKKGALRKKSYFVIVTSKQRFVVIKPDKATVKLTFFISTDSRVFYKDELHFSITPPKGKAIVFEDPQKQAASWVDLLTGSSSKEASLSSILGHAIGKENPKNRPSSSKHSSFQHQ